MRHFVSRGVDDLDDRPTLGELARDNAVRDRQVDPTAIVCPVVDCQVPVGVPCEDSPEFGVSNHTLRVLACEAGLDPAC